MATEVRDRATTFVAAEVSSWLVAAGVLVQAFLAGQFLTTRHGLVAAHRVLAEALPLPGILLVAVAWLLRDQDGPARTLLWSSVAVIVLLVAQTGLGFAGRNSPGALALHVPVGVAVFGFSCLTGVLASNQRRRRSRAGTIQYDNLS